MCLNLLFHTHQLFCASDESCIYTQICNVENIYANGDDALSGATIFSETGILNNSEITSSSNATFKLFLNGTSTNEFTLYCNESDICQIECQSDEACTYLQLYCFGRCLVSCGVYGINCPVLMYGNFTQTLDETLSPSSVPTTIPSVIPSQNPTAIPTVIPTTYPTQIPTNLPSTMPTTMPSALPSQIPSSMPSENPTNTPTQLPSTFPSRIPSSVPSSIPSQIPSIDPTCLPPDAPVDPVTTPQTRSDTNDQSSSGGGVFTETTLIVLIICVSVVIIVLAIIVAVVSERRRKDTMQQKQIEFMQSQTASPTSRSPAHGSIVGDGIRNIDGPAVSGLNTNTKYNNSAKNNNNSSVESNQVLILPKPDPNDTLVTDKPSADKAKLKEQVIAVDMPVKNGNRDDRDVSVDELYAGEGDGNDATTGGNIGHPDFDDNDEQELLHLEGNDRNERQTLTDAAKNEGSAESRAQIAYVHGDGTKDHFVD